MLGEIWGRRKRGWQRMRWLMASPTRWTWVWVNSRRWWWTGRPGMLQFLGSQRVGHDWVTELNWTDLIQNWQRNKKLYGQAEVKKIQHHQTSLETNIKGTYIASKYKRKETHKTNKNKPKIIKKMPIGTYVSIITLNVNGLNAPTKRHKLDECIQKQDPYICCLQETHSTYRLKEDGKIYSMQMGS